MVADTKITELGSDPRSSSTCLWHARLAEEAKTLKDLLSNLKCHTGRIYSSVSHIDIIKIVSARPQWHGASVEIHVDKQSEVCVIGLQGYGQMSTILGTCSNSFLDTVIASINL